MAGCSPACLPRDASACLSALGRVGVSSGWYGNEVAESSNPPHWEGTDC